MRGEKNSTQRALPFKTFTLRILSLVLICRKDQQTLVSSYRTRVRKTRVDATYGKFSQPNITTSFTLKLEGCKVEKMSPTQYFGKLTRYDTDEVNLFLQTSHFILVSLHVKAG